MYDFDFFWSCTSHLNRSSEEFCVLTHFNSLKGEGFYQCEEDTRLHFGQDIGNLRRKAFIRQNRLGRISEKIPEGRWHTLMNKSGIAFQVRFLYEKKSQRWRNTSHRHLKCQPMRRWIINNLQSTALSEHNEQRIVGKDTWAILCAHFKAVLNWDFITAGHIHISAWWFIQTLKSKHWSWH